MLPLGSLISHIIFISYFSYADELHVYFSIKPKETVTQSKSGSPLRFPLVIPEKAVVLVICLICNKLISKDHIDTKVSACMGPVHYITLTARNLGIYDQNFNFRVYF